MKSDVQHVCPRWQSGSPNGLHVLAASTAGPSAETRAASFVTAPSPGPASRGERLSIVGDELQATRRSATPEHAAVSRRNLSRNRSPLWSDARLCKLDTIAHGRRKPSHLSRTSCKNATSYLSPLRVSFNRRPRRDI